MAGAPTVGAPALLEGPILHSPSSPSAGDRLTAGAWKIHFVCSLMINLPCLAHSQHIAGTQAHLCELRAMKLRRSNLSNTKFNSGKLLTAGLESIYFNNLSGIHFRLS